MLKGQQGRNLDNQNILRKQRNPIYGNIYQLKLLMLFLYRGVSNQYSFQLGTEIEEAKKFDDLVFEYVENGEKKYRLLQAKHSWDGSKKVTSADLFTEDDNSYSLVEYFFSYQDSKKEKLFKDSEVKVVVCTNINLDLNDSYKVNGTQTIKELVTEKDEKDNIIDLDTQRKSIKYGFKTDIGPLLHPLLESYNLTRLARSLVKFLLENKNIGHTGKDNIFKFYHIPLAKEVIDVKAKKFYDGFVKDEHTLSDSAKKFRKSFAEETKKQSQGKLIIENINEAISKGEKVIENKEIGLNLSKKFGEGKDKNWPNNVIPKDEIEEFLSNLVFAVNQPNEEELGKIIKNEIGEDLDLDLVTTENTYNKFFITMLR